MVNKVKEKSGKLIKYIKLEMMFRKKSLFTSKYPELASLWKYKFQQMIRYSDERVFSIAEEFLAASIEKMKDCEFAVENVHSPILICVIKNDMGKLVQFMEHYRKLGITKFIFLDNMSTDGTYEYLLKQEDTVVYRCQNSYLSSRRIAWINRIIAEYGIDKWYMVVDSDEFFTYLGAKKYSISEFIQKVEEKGYKRAGVVHLDMYPKGSLFESDSKMDFREKYCYFDKDTYTLTRIKNGRGIKIKGGPRKRVFGTDENVSGVRLMYIEKDDIVASSHYTIPFEKSQNVPIYIVSQHYKFIDEKDYDKMIDAVKTEIYSNGSKDYKIYLNTISENPQVTMYSEEHSLLFMEDNLREIEFLEDAFESVKK